MGHLVPPAHVEPGDTITIADIDDIFSDLEAESANIDDLNTTPEWVSVDHFSWSTAPIVLWADHANQSVGTHVISSTTYATVALTGNDCELVLSKLLAQGDVLRVHATVLASEMDPTDPELDDYYFRIRATIGGVATTILDTRGWSMRCSHDIHGGAGSNIEYNRCSLSCMYIHTSATPAGLTRIWLEAKIRDVANTFTVDTFTLSGMLFGA